MNTSVQGNFIEYTSEDQTVHVKVLRSKDNKKITTKQVSTSCTKQWKVRVKLEEKKKVKKHMVGVRARRKLDLQRKRHKEYVSNKQPHSDSSIFSKDEMLSSAGKSMNEHDYSLSAHLETNKMDVTNYNIKHEDSPNRSVNTDHDHSYSVKIHAETSSRNTSKLQMNDNMYVKISENTDKESNLNAETSSKDVTNIGMSEI